MNKKVLIVDDDRNVRDFLDAVLKTKGHKTELCKNGQEALTRLKDSDTLPDLIITDFQMTPINGIAVVKKAKDLDIPVFLISGHSEPQKHQALRFFKKPFDILDFCKEIKKIFSSRQS